MDLIKSDIKKHLLLMSDYYSAKLLYILHFYTMVKNRQLGNFTH